MEISQEEAKSLVVNTSYYNGCTHWEGYRCKVCNAIGTYPETFPHTEVCTFYKEK